MNVNWEKMSTTYENEEFDWLYFYSLLVGVYIDTFVGGTIWWWLVGVFNAHVVYRQFSS